MSEAGIRVLTDTGELQLNATHKNFVLKRKFKLSTMPQEYIYLLRPTIPDYERLAYVVTLGGNEMFFALGCKDKDKNLYCYVSGIEIYQYNDERASKWYREQESEDANKAYVYVAQDDDIMEEWRNGASAEDIDVYVFGIDDAQVPTHGYGLAIYDENGNSVYYSGNKSMRVLHADYNDWSESKEYTFDSAKDVAIVQTGTAEDYEVLKEMGIFDYVHCYGIKNTGSKVIPFTIYGENLSEDEGATSQQNWLNYVLVDVTGY